MHDATRFKLFGKLGVINHLVTVIELDAQTGETGLDRLNIGGFGSLCDKGLA